jgi:hypothetical protein
VSRHGWRRHALASTPVEETAGEKGAGREEWEGVGSLRRLEEGRGSEGPSGVRVESGVWP